MKTKSISRKRRRGGAAVELIVAFPVILLFFIGIVDYGRVFYTWVAVSNAARAGAEYGQQKFDTWLDPAGQSATAQADGNEVGTITLTPSMVCECNGAAAGCNSVCGSGVNPEVYLKMVASKTITLFFKYPGLQPTATITATAIFRGQ